MPQFSNEGTIHLDDLRTGTVTATVYIDSPRENEAAIRSANDEDNGRRFVTIEIDDIPVHDRLLELLGRRIGDVALMLWPDWYGAQIDLETDGAGPVILSYLNEHLLKKAQLRVRDEWFRIASGKCLADQSPWVSDLSPTVQIRELSKSFSDSELCITIVLSSESAHHDRLMSLVTAAQWVAAEADAAVILNIPASLAMHPAVSRLRIFGEIAAFDERASRLPQSGTSTQTPRRFMSRATERTADESDERKHVLQPLIGRPHPASPGEQKLAEVLANDAELRSLFKFNQRVTTIRGNRPLVDLTWEAGKVVVEVDGYRCHSSRECFANDRQRDYELLITGYVVLRLPHDEVMTDVQLAVDKIRDVVRWRENNLEKLDGTRA